jgi:hypothetical protein
VNTLQWPSISLGPSTGRKGATSMSFMDLITGKKRKLVQLLLSNDESTFLAGLSRASRLCDNGENIGVEAIAEAIRQRSGSSKVSFWAPESGGLVARPLSEIVEAPDTVRKLAQERALMHDCARTQSLLSAIITGPGMGTLREVTLAIAEMGDQNQYFGIQLLYTHMHGVVRLQQARGETTFTQQMSEEARD